MCGRRTLDVGVIRDDAKQNYGKMCCMIHIFNEHAHMFEIVDVKR